jgi:serine/threonine-protein kinase
VVLYEMLSGRAPFESATPEGYIGKHLHTAPPPLDVSALPSPAGPTVAAIVARTLDKKRDRRYATARELADALGAVPAHAAAHPPESDVPSATPAANSGSPRAGTRSLALALFAFLLLTTVVLLARRFGTAPGAAGRVRRPAAVLSPTPRVAAATPAASEAAPPAPAGSEATPPSGSPPAPIASLPPEVALRRIAVWESRPNEPRARLAAQIAQIANRVAAAHPDDPSVAEMRRSLPAFLRTQAAASLDHAEPLLARLYFHGYRALDFAPPDPELERRLERFADGRRPPRTPIPDGR